jgi:hypothetical protein
MIELPSPNGWRGRLVRGVLSAEPILGLPIHQTLLKSGVGAVQRAVRRRLQTPRRILSLGGTRTQYSEDNENKFHGDPIIPRFRVRRFFARLLTENTLHPLRARCCCGRRRR